MDQKIYTAFHKNIPAGMSDCRKKRFHNGTFFGQPLYNSETSGTVVVVEM
jgi:hypothetical protein